MRFQSLDVSLFLILVAGHPLLPLRYARLTNQMPPFFQIIYRVLHTIQTALQHALSHALATCAVSPSSDTGIVRNVLNHYSLTTYTGLTTKFDVDDLSRLCWLWEWDGKTVPQLKRKAQVEDDDNPFLKLSWLRNPRNGPVVLWVLFLAHAQHYLKTAGKRVPAYGIGVEVEWTSTKVWAVVWLLSLGGLPKLKLGVVSAVANWNIG